MALLLIACANLASLTLAQMMSRRHELAMRAALGGGRGAIVRLQFVETLLLAVAGTAAGLVVGRWALPVLLSLDPTLASTLGEVAVDWRVQAGAALAAAIVALASGLGPALRETRGDLVRAIAAGGRRTIGSRRDRRVRAILVGAECALSLVLLTAAALLLSAPDRASPIHPGFDPHGALAAQLPDDFGKEIDVSPVVTGNADGRDIFLDGGAYDVARITMKAEVNDLDAVPNELQVDRVDGAVVTIANRDGGENTNR